jgi:hypothetical protein
MIQNPLFDDERTRAAELFETFAEPIAERLAKRYQGVDPQRIADAIVEAILCASCEWADFGANPMRKMSEYARQVLRRFLRGETRRRRREHEHQIEATAEMLLDDRELAESIRRELAHSSDESRVLDLWLQGHTAPADVGTRMGWSEREASVVLDRIRQRIHRLKERVKRDA